MFNSNAIVVYRNRTNVISMGLGLDVSADTITSEIRREPLSTSELLASWTVTFRTTGVDGELILTLDNSQTVNIEDNVGYMDLKRVTAGEPVPVLEEPILVEFRDVVTA